MKEQMKGRLITEQLRTSKSPQEEEKAFKKTGKKIFLPVLIFLAILFTSNAFPDDQQNQLSATPTILDTAILTQIQTATATPIVSSVPTATLTNTPQFIITITNDKSGSAAIGDIVHFTIYYSLTGSYYVPNADLNIYTTDNVANKSGYLVGTPAPVPLDILNVQQPAIAWNVAPPDSNISNLNGQLDFYYEITSSTNATYQFYAYWNDGKTLGGSYSPNLVIITQTITPTWTATDLETPTPTSTISGTLTETPTFTPTWTLTDSETPTYTDTETATYTPSVTATWTMVSDTPTATVTPTNTLTKASTFTATQTNTPSWTLTESPSYTITATASFTATGTMIFTPTATPINTEEPGLCLRARYIDETDKGKINGGNGQIILTNCSKKDIDLSRISIRYCCNSGNCFGEKSTVLVKENRDNENNDWTNAKKESDNDSDRNRKDESNIEECVKTSITKIQGVCDAKLLEITFKECAGEIKQGDEITIILFMERKDSDAYGRPGEDTTIGCDSCNGQEKLSIYVDGNPIQEQEPAYATPSCTSTPVHTFREDSEAINKATPEEIFAEPDDKNVYNYPNPCNGNTTIRFPLTEPQDVLITISDVSGRMVWKKELTAFDTIAGINHIKWQGVNDTGREVSNGVYILKLILKDRIITKKIAVIR